jgi:hypothetical protein
MCVFIKNVNYYFYLSLVEPYNLLKIKRDLPGLPHRIQIKLRLVGVGRDLAL